MSKVEQRENGETRFEQMREEMRDAIKLEEERGRSCQKPIPPPGPSSVAIIRSRAADSGRVKCSAVSQG